MYEYTKYMFIVPTTSIIILSILEVSLSSVSSLPLVSVNGQVWPTLWILHLMKINGNSYVLESHINNTSKLKNFQQYIEYLQYKYALKLFIPFISTVPYLNPLRLNMLTTLLLSEHFAKTWGNRIDIFSSNKCNEIKNNNLSDKALINSLKA